MKNIYGLDTRSIAVFRIALSCFIALEFALRVLGNFAEVYSPETGMLGNCFAEGFTEYYKGASHIFSIRSDYAMKAFVCSIIAAMGLLAIGVYPRLMAFTGSVLLSLFFNRYPLLYFGWEMYASVMLFWLVLLPSRSLLLGKGVGAEAKNPLVFALLFQIGIIYFYNGISKNGELWMSGNAVESFISDAGKSRAAAAWLLQKPLLTTVLTYFTLLVEVGIMVLLFLPFQNKKLRYAVCFLIFSLHWGIDIFVDVGNFKYVATAVSLLLLPGDVWDIIQKKITVPLWLKKRKLPQYFNRSGLQIPTNIEKVLAVSVCLFILFANLSQTASSMTNDRVKQVVEALHLHKFFAKMNHNALPQYSFFTQYWHLYSPDPPRETGWMQVEFVTENNDTLAVLNGKQQTEDQNYSAPQRNLFSYLLLKKGRNQKDKIAEKCLLLREIKLWNKTQKVKIQSAQLVIYSRIYEPEKWKNKPLPGFSRITYKAIDINYKR